MLPGQHLLQPYCYRSSSTHMQTAVPHAMKAAEGGLTSLLATSSAWQGKPDPHTLVSTMHTTSSSPRTHTHHPQSHRRVCPHTAVPTRTHKEQKSGCSCSLWCPPRLGKRSKPCPVTPRTGCFCSVSDLETAANHAVKSGKRAEAESSKVRRDWKGKVLHFLCLSPFRRERGEVCPFFSMPSA